MLDEDVVVEGLEAIIVFVFGVFAMVDVIGEISDIVVTGIFGDGEGESLDGKMLVVEGRYISCVVCDGELGNAVD